MYRDVTGSNLVEALIFFFSGFFRNYINCVQNFEDYSSVDYFAIS